MPERTNNQVDLKPDQQHVAPVSKSTIFSRIWGFLHTHETLLWWLHSVWAFAFGIGMMVLGSKRPDYVRIIIFHLGFIWMTSLFLPFLFELPHISEKWSHRIRMVVNYFNKNFYQQLLFFVIPIYYTSTTLRSRNVVFFAALCISAALSTLDVVYDRYLSAKWPLSALFLAFNIFSCIYVMQMMMWSISNHLALYISALFALLAFASMLYRFGMLRGHKFWPLMGAALVLLLFLVRIGAPLIPPATLSLGEVEIGKSVARNSYKILNPIQQIPSGYKGTVAVLTPIRAPFGLKETVLQRWHLDGKLVFTSPTHQILGGRQAGFRYWSAITVTAGPGLREVQVDVETESGQLIGRVRIPVASAPQ